MMVVRRLRRLIVGWVAASGRGRGDIDWQCCHRKVVGMSGSSWRLVGVKCVVSWTGSWESQCWSRARISIESSDRLECGVYRASMKGRLGSCIGMSGSGRRS